MFGKLNLAIYNFYFSSFGGTKITVVFLVLAAQKYVVL